MPSHRARKRALALGEEPGSAPDAALSGFADALEHAPLDGDARVQAARLAEEIRGWAADSPPLREVEPMLAERESKLLARLRDRVSADQLAEIERAADAELALYARAYARGGAGADPRRLDHPPRARVVRDPAPESLPPLSQAIRPGAD